MERIYLEKVLDNALLLEGDWDFVVIHDPQPAAMLEFVARLARVEPPEHEVDLALPHRPHRRQPDGVGVLPPVRRAATTRRCGRCRSSCPRRSTMDHVVHAPPCIDPLSVKNLDLADAVRRRDLQAVRRRRRTTRSSCQVSRFDPWKDPVGVIEAFRIVRERVPDAQLVLAGSMATDDPEGFHVLGAHRTRRAPATATSTCSRTSSRSARCRSTRSSAPPTSCCRSRCARASASR